MESQQNLKSLINLMLNIGYRQTYVTDMVDEYLNKLAPQNLKADHRKEQLAYFLDPENNKRHFKMSLR